MYTLAGSPGQVVMGEDSKSWVRIPAPYTAWTFFHMPMCVWKDENKWIEAGVGTLFKLNVHKQVQ